MNDFCEKLLDVSPCPVEPLADVCKMDMPLPLSQPTRLLFISTHKTFVMFSLPWPVEKGSNKQI